MTPPSPSAPPRCSPSYIVKYLNTLIDEFFVYRSEMRTGGPDITISN